MEFKSYLEPDSNEVDNSELDNTEAESSEATLEQLIYNFEQRGKLRDNYYSRLESKYSTRTENENDETDTMQGSTLVDDTSKKKDPEYESEEISRHETQPEDITKESKISETLKNIEIPTQHESIKLINPRALSKSAKTYELENFEKKILIIFNHYNINGYKDPRFGTHKDVEVLRNTFENLGFDVEEHTDFTRDEIFAKLQSISISNFVDYGCVAVAVLTHGSHHGLLMAKDEEYSEQVIIEHLKVHNNPTLITKPKMLIIQACRGDRSPRGVEVHQPTSRIYTDNFHDVEHYSLPIAADMVVVHSTFVGYPAKRCGVNGSWFIQSLCEKIDLLASDMDFEAIFKEVQNDIAIEKYHWVHNKLTQKIDLEKQMPMITSSLIRKLYLRRYRKSPMESSADSTSFQFQEPSTPVTPMPVSPSDEPSSSSTKVSLGSQVTMQYFDYLKECLRRYVEENSDDKIAQSLLMVADTFGNGKKFKEPKKKMCSAICQHFTSNSESIAYYKYLFICESFTL